MVRAEVDIHPHRQFASMTALLVGVIVALYIHTRLLDDQASLFLRTHGAVPPDLLHLMQWRYPYSLLAGMQMAVTSLFLQPTALHLAANVLLLLLFGASVEDRLGHYRFLLLFLVAGVVAVFAQSLLAQDSRLALIGAQAGVAGIAGACVALSPRGSVPTMVRGIEFPWILGPIAWLAVQLLVSAIRANLPDGTAVVGMPAVLLGFACGLGLGPLYRHHRPVLLRG